MKQVLECVHCLADITVPITIGEEVFDCLDIGELHWDDIHDPIEETEARQVLVEYWTGDYWGDGQHMKGLHYWINPKALCGGIFPDKSGRYQCDCDVEIGRQVSPLMHNYYRPDPDSTSWIEHIDHGKKRKFDKKSRLKAKKNEKA